MARLHTIELEVWRHSLQAYSSVVRNYSGNLILVPDCRDVGKQTGMMMNGKNTYLAFSAIYVEYDVIFKNGDLTSLPRIV